MKDKKIIAAVLGIVVLIMGVAFGVLLVGQNQDFREKAAPATTLSLSASTTTPVAGDEFTVSVQADTGPNEVIAAELYFTFDPAIVEVTNVTPGAFFSDPEVVGPVIDNEVGELDYVIFILPGVTPSSGVGELAEISFRAKTVGSTTIALTNDSLVGATDENAQNVLIGTTPVTVNVVADGIGGGNAAVTPTATPTPTGTANPTATPTPTTAASGGTSATSTPTPTIELPDELMDSGVPMPTIFGAAIGVIMIGGALVLAL